MTKAQIKHAYIKWNRENSSDWDVQSATLHELQKLNKEFGDGHAWCSYRMLIVGIIKGGDTKVINKAFDLYEKVIQTDAKNDCVRDFAVAVDNFDSIEL